MYTPVRFHAGRRADALREKEAPQGKPEDTRVDFYAQQLRAHRHRLPPSLTYHCVDGYYAKKKHTDEVANLDLHVITKLRSGTACFSTPDCTRSAGARLQYAGRSTSKT